jgi:hypothetical protein
MDMVVVIKEPPAVLARLVDRVELGGEIGAVLQRLERCF